VIVDYEGQEKTIPRNPIIPIRTTFRPVSAERKAIIRENNPWLREKEELMHESAKTNWSQSRPRGLSKRKKMDEAMVPQPLQIQEMHAHAEVTPEEHTEESDPVEEVKSSTRLRKKPKWHDTYDMSQTQVVENTKEKAQLLTNLFCSYVLNSISP
jgi:hypothetical protein